MNICQFGRGGGEPKHDKKRKKTEKDPNDSE